MTDFLTKLKALSSRHSSSSGSSHSSSRHGNSNSAKSDAGSSDPETQNHRAAPDAPSIPFFDKVRDAVAKPRTQKTRRRSTQPSGDSGEHTQRSRRRHPLYQKWWAWGVLGLGFGLGGVTIAVNQAIVAIDKGLPNPQEVLTYVRPGTLTVKASDGTILQQTGPATRNKVTLDKMPPRLTQAFIASEDQEFYNHHGVNYLAVVRASVKNLTSGQVVEGASTITQQLARIVFLDREQTMSRKVREALLAQKMENELDKKQILERYLNLVYLGSGAYGVADAAWIYFSKNVSQLSLGEIAMLAGMAPAPSLYSPLVNPKLARERRDTVLQRMLDVGYITQAERDATIATPITLKPGAPKNLYSEVPYFTSYIQQQLPKYVSQEELEKGGLTVETTLNLKWQKRAQVIIKNAIANYGPGDGFGQAALASVDPRTGEIKALVGGNDFEKSQFNRATQAQRQPGSTFKAVVYSTAIAAGFSPYRPYVDAKYVVDGYEPHDYDKSYRGSMSIRDAIISSINIIAVKTLVDVGWDPIIAMGKRMGIKSKLLPTYSLALGTSEVNVLELTSAYGTLADKGNHIEAHGITRIIDRFGKVIYQAKFPTQRALDADSAAIMTWMLQGVVDSGTGRNAYLSDRQVAGKTGTSEKRRDLWFVGYIPQLVTGIWLGNDDSSPTWGASSTAALTWYNFMSGLTKDIPAQDFPKLPDLNNHKSTIKAKPLHPARVYESSSAGSDQSNDSETGSGQSTWSAPKESYSGGGSSKPSSEPAASGSSSGSANSAGSQAPAPPESASPASETPKTEPSSPAAPVNEAPPPAEPAPSQPAPPELPAPPPISAPPLEKAAPSEAAPAAPAAPTAP